tara:strand:+ start:575 stop:1975 length:1401 start_codon:yes stop_codon:yes gene_type:complete
MNREGYSSQSSLADVAIFPIVAVGLILGLWFLAKSYILYACFYASFYLFGVYEHLTWLMTETELQTITAARKSIASINPTQHGFKSFLLLMEYHSYILRWLVLPLIALLAYRVKTKTVRFKYKRIIKDVYDLIEIQAKHFPASAIIRGKNLLEKDPNVGPWATYTLPLDFALDNRLLWTSNKRVKIEDRVDENSMVPIPPFTPAEKSLTFPEKRLLLPSNEYVSLSLKRTNRVFLNQVGKVWTGSKNLPPLERALYAAFCAQACADRRAAWTMIEQLAFSFKEGEIDKNGKLVSPHHADTKGTDALLKKYGNRKEVLKIAHRHAHTINVMRETLTLARENGRLFHSNFLWLKPVNRILWYALCGEGGQVPYWEAAGPWAHTLVEIRAGKKLIKPMVAGAVDQMLQTMQREHWIDAGKYSEEYQKKLVLEANELLDKEEAKSQQKQSFGGGGFMPPKNKAKRKDDTP